jgi:hypothetical protein
VALEDRGSAPSAGADVATVAWVASQGYAPLASPAFTGAPTAPTQTQGHNDTTIATTAFVVAGLAPKANLASPALTGTPTAPTAAANTNTTQIATTAYVQGEISGFASLASPAFTGTPTAPTQASTDNSTRIATTAFVNANTATDAPLASPAFTGTPTAPTPGTSDNSTRIATTAMVQAVGNLQASLTGATFTGAVNVPSMLASGGSYKSTFTPGAIYSATVGSAGSTWGGYVETELGVNGINVNAGANSGATTTALGLSLSNATDVLLSAHSSGGSINITAGGADLLISNDGNPRISSGSIYGRTYAGVSADTSTGGSSNGFVVMTSAGTFGLSKGYVQVPDAYSRVVSTRAVYITNLGTFGTTSSSKKTKDLKRIVTWTDTELRKWLGLPVWEFEYKPDLVDPAEVGVVHHGVVAEQVQIRGFDRMLYHEERDGHPNFGEVTGFAYEKMGVYNHLAMRVQQRHIDALEKRIAALESRIPA